MGIISRNKQFQNNTIMIEKTKINGIPQIIIRRKLHERKVFKKRCNKILEYLSNKELTTKELSKKLKVENYKIRKCLNYLKYYELIISEGKKHYIK